LVATESDCPLPDSKRLLVWRDFQHYEVPEAANCGHLRITPAIGFFALLSSEALKLNA
jgi:hypothetical protein